MIRAVLDTNVLASGIVGVAHPFSPPGELVRRWRRNGFALVVSEHILGELDRTFRKPYFAERISPEQRQRVMWAIRHIGEVTPITVAVTGVATHPEDDRILATVASSQAAYLITGDADLRALGMFGNARIVTASQFVMILDNALKIPPDE
jgi:putative PIN family toxin of toxin-antitoxin system